MRVRKAPEPADMQGIPAAIIGFFFTFVLALQARAKGASTVQSRGSLLGQQIKLFLLP